MTYRKPIPKPYSQRDWEIVNNVRRMWQSGCFGDWELWIETAKEPLYDLILELLVFDEFDLIRSCLRPARLFGGGHRPGRRKGRRLPNFPEPSDMICRALVALDDDSVSKRRVHYGVYTMWQIDGLLQRGLYWFMIAELSTEFAYQWTTNLVEAITETENCFGKAKCDCTSGGITGGNVWQPPAPLKPKYSYGSCLANSNGSVSCGPGQAEVSAGMVARPAAGHTYQIRIRTFNLGILVTTGFFEGDENDLSAGLLIPPQTVSGIQSYLIEGRVTSGPLTPMAVDYAWCTVSQ